MKKKWKRGFAFLLAVAMALLFSGCARETPPEEITVRKIDFDISEPITLRILIDPHSDEWGERISNMIDDFTAIYKDVTIELEWLTSLDDNKYGNSWADFAERDLEKMNQEIATGGGPDIFIINNFKTQARPVEDANIAMRQGYFADLNEFYLTDSELNREGLIDEIMEAGVVGEARYLLPLDYSFLVANVNPERLYDAGLDSKIFHSGVTGLLNEVSRLGDADVANALSGVIAGQYYFTYFPNPLDYDTKEVLLTSEELTEFLEAVQTYKSLCGKAYPNHGLLSAFCEGEHWYTQGYCMEMCTLTYLAEETATAKALEFELKTFPLTGVEETLTAEIPFYGAVSSNCDYPEVAYEFLRMFLLPETQTADGILSGYPVRTHGYVSARFQNYYDSALSEINAMVVGAEDDEAEELQQRREVLNGIEVTDSDIPILQNTIEVAQIMPWELKAELSAVIKQLNDPATGEPTDVDIEALAHGYIDFLTVYLKGQLGAE